MYIKTEDGDLVKAKKDIKILNLFNMTAGLTYNTNSDGIQRARNLTQGKMDTDVVVRCIADDPLSFEPGTMFQYSLCHDVLAGLVAIVSGTKFRDYMKSNIFDPLGMSSAVYHLTPEIEKNMATQYRFVSEKCSAEADIVKAQQYGNESKGHYVEVGAGNTLVLGEEYDSGGAGIISNVSDYALLAAALANFGLGLTGERILLPVEFIDEIFGSHTKTMYGNLYKCGDETEKVHYATFYPIETKEPDYHRPEFFGEFVLE